MRDSPRPPRPPSVPALRVPGGVKHARYDLITAIGAGTWRAPRSGWYWALAYGPGGTGGSTPGTAASGGGGGGADGSRFWAARGQPVAYSIATPGSDTTITLAGRLALIATSGAAGAAGFVLGGAGGVGLGGQLRRRGGAGGGSTNPNGDPNDDDGQPVAPQDGEYGGKGLGAAGAGGGAGSGGGAGFTDILPNVKGDGSASNAGVVPGGGGSGSTVGYAGASGAVAFVFDG